MLKFCFFKTINRKYSGTLTGTLKRPDILKVGFGFHVDFYQLWVILAIPMKHLHQSIYAMVFQSKKSIIYFFSHQK